MQAKNKFRKTLALLHRTIDEYTVHVTTSVEPPFFHTGAAPSFLKYLVKELLRSLYPQEKRRIGWKCTHQSRS